MAEPGTKLGRQQGLPLPSGLLQMAVVQRIFQSKGPPRVHMDEVFRGWGRKHIRPRL